MDQKRVMIAVSAPAVSIRALTWGPSDGPIALCLHGFPDTAHGWRKVAPLLAAAGWKVVAPFLRGYAPSSVPSDGAYHAPALMDDALRVRAAVRPTGDVVIGHDFGAVAATGLAAMPDGPFAKAVIMAAPPYAAFRPVGRVPHMVALTVQLARQAVMSCWYITFMHVPWIPERSQHWLLPRLWRSWSPRYDATEDLALVESSIGAPDR